MEELNVGKELVWVSKELVETVNKLDAGVATQEDILKVFKEFKSEIENYTYDIEESAAMFRRQSQKVKDSFKQVVDNEVEALQEFWDTQDEKRAEIQKKFSSFKNGISSAKDEILSLKQSIRDLDIYGLDKLVELVEKINCMSDKDKELLQYVFSHGKKN